MNGSLKLSTKDGNAIEVEASLTHVGAVDKIKLLHAFCEALQVDETIMHLFMLMREELDDSTEKVKVDLNGLEALRSIFGDTDE